MAHTWSFFRAGGVDQVQLRTSADLLALGELDQKLWVALACPVKGLELDERTLALIDSDGDGRVHAAELIDVIQWTADQLVDPEILFDQRASLALSAISDASDEGKLLRDTAKALLKSLDKEGETSLALADVKDAIEKFNAGAWNGDGVVPASSTEDEGEKQAIVDVLSCTKEPATDKNGDPGITAESLGAFFEALAAYVAWLDEGQADEKRPLGDATDAAHEAYAKVASKVDDFFTRCRVAAFDPRALNAVNREESEYLAAAAKDLQITADEVAHFPLAHVESGANLPLGAGLNPAWMDAVLALREKVIVPLLGERDALGHEDWMEVRAKLAAHVAWQAEQKGAEVASLGPARARELAEGGWKEKLEALVAKDEEARPLAEAREKVEKLLHMTRDLVPVVNNFVSFRDFYARKGPAAFQVGTLYIDQRACELCILVNDAAKHATMSPHSKAYVLYCDLRNAKGDTMSVAAAVTNGSVDNLMVGRNGLFYDRKGGSWDATVTRIVDNPISVRQAFWSPYKKLLRLIEDQVARRAQAAEERADASISATAEGAEAATSGARPPAVPRKIDIGVVAALGVAVGGITAALGMLLESFFGLGLWMPLGVLGLILLISGPSMAIAWLKLRQRNLGPLLDANGWAVNTLAKVNVPFGEALTSVAEIPKGSKRDLHDPFAEKKRPWKLYVFLLVVLGLGLGWYLGAIDDYLPWPSARSTEVLGDAAPANVRARAIEAAEAAEAEPAE
ncbi:MAG: hypothetical protein KF901_03835 [Myxococcales bacterium]|nr:hypothetical protein [Myxococcales bacterium]